MWSRPAPTAGRRPTAQRLLVTAVDIHGDLLRLRFLTLRHADGEQAILIARLNAIGVDRRRQRERPAEAAVGALAAVIRALRGIELRLALAGERQHAVLE